MVSGCDDEPLSPLSSPRPAVRWSALLAVALLNIRDTLALDARWGHSVAFLSSPPTFLVVSGKTTPDNGQTYTSSPTISTFLAVPLSAAFSLTESSLLSTTSTPALAVSNPGAAPPYAWGNLETLSDGSLLAFGGDGSPGTAIQTGSDSVWTLPSASAAAFVHDETGWGDQPMRRMGAASCTHGINTYITAGERADGSELPFLTTYAYSSTGRSFTELGATLSTALLQPSLHCLTNGSILLLGGFASSSNSLAPLSTAYMLDPNGAQAEWTQVRLEGESIPPGRRAHLGVTLGNGAGVFVAGGGTGANGMENVLDDSWILDLEKSQWIQVAPAGSGPGGRLGAKGVAIGQSQVLFFGGYTTSSAADSSLYLYDLGTNAYLSTFTPPSAWTSVGSPSQLETAPPGQTADATITSGVTITSTMTNLLPTLTTVDSLGNPTTLCLTSTSLTTVTIDSLVPGHATATNVDPTYMGVDPGYVTRTSSPESLPGASESGGTGSGSSSGSGSDPNGSETPEGGGGGVEGGGGGGGGGGEGGGGGGGDGGSGGRGGGGPSTLAIALGATSAFLALAGGAAAYVIYRHRRAASDGSRWVVLGEKRRRNDDDDELGRWLDVDSQSNGKRRLVALSAIGAGLATRAKGVFAGPYGGQYEKRVDMLGDEDTRRYDSYPPHDGSSAHSGYPGLGMGLWNRSSSFVGGLVNSRRDVSGGSGIGFEGGDLGAAGRSGYDHADDEGTGLLHAGEVDSHGADSPQTDGNPFAEMHSAATPASSSSHPCDLPRSPGMVPFYPGTNYPITSSSYLPYSAPSSTDHSHSSDDPSSQFHTSSEETSYLPSPVSASAHRPTYPLAVSRSSAAIAGGQQGISRSESSLGWRRVLGLGRPKSPSALTTPTASVLWQLRDPAPPPELEFVRDSTQELGGMHSSKWHQARLQERSLSSITSARTATSEQIERLANMDVVQRYRTSSSTTPSLLAPEMSPNLASASRGSDTFFRRRTSSSHTLSRNSEPSSPDIANPFDDANAAAAERTRSTSPALGPFSLAGAVSNSSSDANTPTSVSPMPKSTRQSVKDKIAAFEQQHSAGPTAPLNIPKRSSIAAVAPKRVKSTFVAVPRPRLGVTNPDT